MTGFILHFCKIAFVAPKIGMLLLVFLFYACLRLRPYYYYIIYYCNLWKISEVIMVLKPNEVSFYRPNCLAALSSSALKNTVKQNTFLLSICNQFSYINLVFTIRRILLTKYFILLTLSVVQFRINITTKL